MPRDYEPSELTVESWSYFSDDTESTDAGTPTPNTDSLNMSTAIKVPDVDSSGSEDDGYWEAGSVTCLDASVSLCFFVRFRSHGSTCLLPGSVAASVIDASFTSA